ncbi:MAG TPA: hydroxyacid dehydrogenase [Terriglobales bacterium]|nr:hydroxyacid dehydrogenase [Terriglobales bacterium]
MKIVVPEKISSRGIAEFEAAGFQVVQLTPASVASGELARELADAEALVVRSAVKVTRELMAAAPALRVIGRAGVGVDNVDVAAATARKIVVMNTPGGSSAAVAELALGLMLALARQIPRADATMHAGQWEKKSLEGSELMGKTLGLVGFGRIAVEVAKRAEAFGMRVIAYDPLTPLESARKAGVALMDLDQVFASADYLSLHASLTPQSQNLLNDAAFAKMKKGVRIINCSRGEIVDEAALARALQSGHVAGAALDVYAKEPPGASPLLALPNVIATPHLGASTQEAQERVGHAIAIQIRDFLLQGTLANAVNA